MSMYSRERQQVIVQNVVNEWCGGYSESKIADALRQQAKHYIEDRGDVDLEKNLRELFENLLR